METLFTELNGLLRGRVDRLMVQFKNSAPDFWNEYRSARVVVDPSSASPATEKASARPGTTNLPKAA